MSKILIVEDNLEICNILKTRFTLRNYEVELVHDGWAVISHLMKPDPGPKAVILDLMVPGRSGYELIGSIKSKWPKTKIFIFSAHADYKRKIPPGLVDGFLIKTDGVENLIKAVEASPT